MTYFIISFVVIILLVVVMSLILKNAVKQVDEKSKSYFVDKLKVRGREYSSIDEQDEELLINPNNKSIKGKTSITKIFGNFIGTKED